MIAQPNHHYDAETLQQLLDDRLAGDLAEKIEFHLNSCETCRRELKQLAGQLVWWDETVDVLSESKATKSPPVMSVSGSAKAIDAALDWIRPLLEDEVQQDGFLGRIDQYWVQQVIGQGGMGVVLRGIDRELNRPVAIKVLSPHLAGVGTARVRFMREAQAAAAVVHPSIVPIYSVVPSARLPYIVMPCILGGNLQQKIDREGPLDLGELVRIGLQIAEGLAAAHRNGVIHRDIKPANVLIEEGNGRALISDFGLARALDDASLTNSGMIAGTPQFMSPEQARGESTDARSDLFSLGSLLYAAATGRPPFRAETPLAVLRKISESRPRPIHEVNERMPGWIDRLVGQLMQIETGDRIDSADAVADQLRDVYAHLRNPAGQPLPPSLTARRRTKRWMLPAGVGLTLIVLLIAVSWVGFPRWSTPQVSGGAATQIDPSQASARAMSTPSREQASDPSLLDWQNGQIESELDDLQRILAGLDEALASPEDGPIINPSFEPSHVPESGEPHVVNEPNSKR